MKRAVALLVLISAATVSGETVFEQSAYSRYGGETVESNTLHTYNVLRYNLYMDWYDGLSGKTLGSSGLYGYYGRMEITFAPSLSDPLDSIRLDSNPAYLHIDSVFSGGARLNAYQRGEKLTIVLNSPLSSPDSSIVDIYYHEIDPGAYPSTDTLQRGFYLYFGGTTTKGPTSTGVQDTVAYTMSEPSDARDWMPCYDEPWDKAFCQISVRVPNGFTAASNGTLISAVNNGDGSTTFNWKEDYPVATYLMCATAARYAVIQKDYVSASGNTIPVQYYAYREDSLQALEGAGCNIDSVISWIKFYSSLYGPYPFDKYGMTGVQPFQYGGMEHQTITTLNLKYEFDRRDVAHELAHQWWGDMVTLGTWKDIWLNEGFATYSEAMQLQHQSQTAFEDEMLFYASQFFIEDSTQLRYAIYAPPAKYLFGLAEYYKAAWVLNMLRNIVGDTTYFDIMRRYGADYEYGNAVTSDFIAVVDTVYGHNMQWFFDEWIYKAGYPVYTKSYIQSSDSVSVTIHQVQSDTLVYRMPMDVGIYSGGSLKVETVNDSLRNQTFVLPFQGKIDSVVLDPYHKVLARYPGQSLTGVSEVRNEPGTYSVLQNYPNPFNGRTEVVYQLASPGQVSVELYDVLGRKVETLARGFQAQGVHRIAVNGGDLASGVYFCRVITPDRRMVTKLVLEK